MTFQEGRRQDVIEKFRELLSQIATHEKQLESAKKTGEESVKKKDAQMKRVLRREAEVKRTIGEQKTIIKNLASIWKSRRIGQKYIRRKDQQKNLQLLEEAMKANEISQELYEVQRFFKLKCLVERPAQKDSCFTNEH